MADQSTRPIAVFTAGTAASGKSTALRSTEWAGLPVVDPDQFKPLHPDYDPKAPELVHEWSKVEASKLRRKYLTDGVTHVVDGTGAKPASFCARIEEARAAGFSIKVLWVQCDLRVALDRNAARERSVKPEVLRGQAAAIPFTMAIATDIVDEIRVVDTNPKQTFEEWMNENTDTNEY